MEAHQEYLRQDEGDEQEPLFAHPPGRVVIAYDQLTREEKEGVRTALHILEREGLNAPSHLGLVRLAGLEPLYVLCAAPEVRVIVRMEPGAPVEVEDIVRPETLRNFAHAGAR
ncbi:MAG: hypothetical protein M3Y74_21750 [Chloroflexota bacterium]|nr:hypothetical protein [Chloroflexota bacterium]